MKKKNTFEKHLEQINKGVKTSLKEANMPEKIDLPEGEEYDIDSLIDDVNQMQEDLKSNNLFMFDIDGVLNEMHDSKLHQERPIEEEDSVSRLPNGELGYINDEGEEVRPAIDPPFHKIPKDPALTDEYKTWEKGNAKINESMKIYNDQKKQSYKGEKEKETFHRLMGYEIPSDKERVAENAMWGYPKQLDRLVVLMDTQEAVLLTKDNFDFSKLDEANEMNASKAGHSLNVFDQLFETWYEYTKEDFEKLL